MAPIIAAIVNAFWKIDGEEVTVIVSTVPEGSPLQRIDDSNIMYYFDSPDDLEWSMGNDEFTVTEIIEYLV